jgi:RNA polymerase sigma factor (sigma-70 family)
MSELQHTNSAADEQLIELMVAYQHGDLSAFERLHDLLVDDVRRYFARACRDRRAVNDLVQDMFLEMHRSRRTYQPQLPVRPWAFGIARNVLARSRRTTWHRREHSSFEAEGESVAFVPAIDAHAADLLDIETALASLPAGNRDPWMLHHVFGFSFPSIAARLGITVMAAKLRSSRATRALRAALRGSRSGR